jgi:hypothetical protein
LGEKMAQKQPEKPKEPIRDPGKPLPEIKEPRDPSKPLPEKREPNKVPEPQKKDRPKAK